MPKVELAKSIEARKLNRRTGQPVDTLWLTVPFGAILDNAIEKGELVEFSYLGDLYQIYLWRSATDEGARWMAAFNGGRQRRRPGVLS